MLASCRNISRLSRVLEVEAWYIVHASENDDGIGQVLHRESGGERKRKRERETRGGEKERERERERERVSERARIREEDRV